MQLAHTRTHLVAQSRRGESSPQGSRLSGPGRTIPLRPPLSRRPRCPPACCPRQNPIHAPPPGLAAPGVTDTSGCSEPLAVEHPQLGGEVGVAEKPLRILCMYVCMYVCLYAYNLVERCSLVERSESTKPAVVQTSACTHAHTNTFTNTHFHKHAQARARARAHRHTHTSGSRGFTTSVCANDFRLNQTASADLPVSRFVGVCACVCVCVCVFVQISYAVGAAQVVPRMSQRQADRQTDRQTERQTDRQTDRQTHRQRGVGG